MTTISAPPSTRAGLFSEAWRSVRDVRSLMSFRVAGLRGRSRRGAKISIAVFVLLTVASAIIE